MKAKHVTWYPYSKQTIISKNKMEKIMNRNNGEYRVLTWKASSQTKARLTPSSLFLLSLENLLSPPHPPSQIFPSLCFLSSPVSPSSLHCASPREDVILNHHHGQPCPLPPVYATGFPPERGPHSQKKGKKFPSQMVLERMKNPWSLEGVYKLLQLIFFINKIIFK